MQKVVPITKAKIAPQTMLKDIKPTVNSKRKKRSRKASFRKVTCKRFWREFSKQAATILKTATAISIALLWSTTINSLLNAIYANFFVEGEIKYKTQWTGFVFTSLLVISLVPIISFRYLHSHDFWAVMLFVEILGHLWGFKIKDLIVNYAYDLHWLRQAYQDETDGNLTQSYCNLVSTNFYVSSDSANGVQIDATDMGWKGYNLDWTSYTQDHSVFDNYYETSYNDSSNVARRRHLLGERIVPSPAAIDDFMGPRVDVTATDAFERGPGKTCNFAYHTTQVLKGFHVEKYPRVAYLWELGWRFGFWIAMLAVCLLFVVVIRAIYNKLVFPICCKGMRHKVKHNWTHLQNHLIADAWANGMGWISSFFFWWLTIILILFFANLWVPTSPCNGMHAFPIATLFFTLVMFLLMAQLLVIGRMSIWAGCLKCWPGIKEWLGGVGELQNGFMLGWYLVNVVEYLHSTFIAPFIESGFEDWSPFDDIYETHHAPTPVLALEEVIEATLLTVLGLLYLTQQQLQIKAKHRETHLLKEAARRLQNYFALTRSFATTTTANDIKKLIDKRKLSSRFQEKRATITARAMGIWMGLTIELGPIHIGISLLEKYVLEEYNRDDTNINDASYGYSEAYSLSYYTSAEDYDYTGAATQEGIVFATQFAVSATLTGIFFAVMFCSHHMSWQISTEKERLAAVLLQSHLRGLQHKLKFGKIWRARSKNNRSRAGVPDVNEKHHISQEETKKTVS
jgi:hypothetical protein